MPPRPKMFSGDFFADLAKIKTDISKLFRIALPIPVGAVFPFAGTSLPDGYLLCDGTIYNIADYADLGAYLGSLYGGNGTTTFAVPNYSGKFMQMVLTGGNVGVTGGAQGHNHPLSSNGNAQIGLGGGAVVYHGVGRAFTATNAGTTLTIATSTAAQSIGASLDGNTDTNSDTRPPFIGVLPGIKF